MTDRTLAWTIALALAVALVACSGGEGDDLGDGDPFADGDGDVDSDVDSDSDTDVDSDSDDDAGLDDGGSDAASGSDGLALDGGYGRDAGRDGGTHSVDDGDCLEGCMPCTFGADDCCGNSVCQDDWSGETFCMPVVPPHSGGCPTSEPEEGTACDEPGMLCRYTGSNRCKCGCAGWECPFGD